MEIFPDPAANLLLPSGSWWVGIPSASSGWVGTNSTFHSASGCFVDWIYVDPARTPWDPGRSHGIQARTRNFPHPCADHVPRTRHDDPSIRSAGFERRHGVPPFSAWVAGAVSDQGLTQKEEFDSTSFWLDGLRNANLSINQVKSLVRGGAGTFQPQGWGMRWNSVEIFHF